MTPPRAAGVADVAGTEEPDARRPPLPGVRWVDALDPPARIGLTIFCFAVPVAIYLWMIHADGINVIFQDEWSDIEVIRRSYDGTLNFGSLWALHNENRVLVPNLIVLLLSRTTRLNVVWEEYLGAAMLFGAVAMIVQTHRRRSPATPLLYYVPVALLMLSVVQYENSLWGFQLAWYVVLVAFAGALLLLDRPVLSWPITVGAIAVTVVASFSSLQGLLVWPVGLVLLYHRRRSLAVVLAWVAAGAATSVLYFWNYSYTDAYSGSVLRSPGAALHFFAFAVGDIVGVDLPGFGSKDNLAVLLFGIAVLVMAVSVLVLYGIRRDTTGGGPIGVALILFGLLFVGVITQGRLRGGLYFASAPRYRTYDVLILAGCYLALLSRPSLPRPRHADAGPEPGAATGRAPRRARLLTGAQVTVLMMIAIQFVVGVDTGWTGAQNFSRFERLDARALAGYPRTPLTLTSVLNGGVSPGELHQLVPVLRSHRLSLFGSGQLAHYRKLGPPRDSGLPVTRILEPADGATVSGPKVTLVAAASDAWGVTGVEFRLSGGAVADAPIGTGAASAYGWYVDWNTTTVPNGTYTLESVAEGAAGDQGRSPPVTVVVENTAHPAG